MMAMKNLVLYHDNCNDGFCAMWLWQKFVDERGEFQAVQYGQPAPTSEEVAGRNVVILDFSYPREDMERIHAAADSVLVFDHHKTAQEALAGLEYCTFHMEKSGARLVWEYIFKGDDQKVGRPTPWLVSYTEDRDLWRHKLPDTKEINAALFSYSRSFQVWNRLCEKPTREMAEEGRGILRYQEGLVKAKTADRSKRLYANIGGYVVPVVNATCLLSEIAGELAREEPFAAAFFVVNHQEVVYSLRSRADQDHTVDVSEVAKQYGGGGHKNAAGFTVDRVLEMGLLVPTAHKEGAST